SGRLRIIGSTCFRRKLLPLPFLPKITFTLDRARSSKPFKLRRSIPRTRFSDRLLPQGMTDWPRSDSATINACGGEYRDFLRLQPVSKNASVDTASVD